MASFTALSVYTAAAEGRPQTRGRGIATETESGTEPSGQTETKGGKLVCAMHSISMYSM